MTDVVVVGGGITGLVAARQAALAGAAVTLLEPGPLGGKLQTTPFAGAALDESADAFLARVPEGVALCRDLGLEGDLVSPAARRAYVWVDGALRLLPEAQVLGVPTDLDELAASGIVSPGGVEAARLDLSRPLVPPEGDVTIGAFLRDRLGDEVTDRLVAPLVGGINAGDVEVLSLAATVPQLDAAARSGASSLIEACAAQRAAVADRSAPVFYTPRGGMGALVAALQDDLARRGVAVVRQRASGIEVAGDGWVVLAGEPGRATARLAAEAVIVTTDASTAARLVASVARPAAQALAAIPYASVAMVSIAVPRAGVDRELDGSGFLVPPSDPRTITACSWTSSKWAHLGSDDTVWLRASAGRHGDEAALALDDDALVAAVLADLAETMALHGTPDEIRLTRWPRSFPQYLVGHLDRMDALDAALPPTLAVTGAAHRGLGIPACIRQAGHAAAQVLSALPRGS